MANFDELISRLHADYPEEQLRGKAFERVCKWFLTEDPYYGQEFRNVWFWDEWPGRWGPDIGIDLVAETVTGVVNQQQWDKSGPERIVVMERQR